MKKIIALISGIVLISSCEEIRETVWVKMDGWATPVNTETTKNWIDVSVYEYDGHTYLIFGRTEVVNGVVHDPNCVCTI